MAIDKGEFLQLLSTNRQVVLEEFANFIDFIGQVVDFCCFVLDVCVSFVHLGYENVTILLHCFFEVGCLLAMKFQFVIQLGYLLF